jgi:hypothetical protein
MIASTYSAFNVPKSHPFNPLRIFSVQKHTLLLMATQILIFILFFQALFNHNTEQTAEIEEEEPELVVILSPGTKRSSKKSG